MFFIDFDYAQTCDPDEGMISSGTKSNLWFYINIFGTILNNAYLFTTWADFTFDILAQVCHFEHSEKSHNLSKCWFN